MAQTSVCKKDDPGHMAVTTTDSTQQIPRSKKHRRRPNRLALPKGSGFCWLSWNTSTSRNWRGPFSGVRGCYWLVFKQVLSFIFLFSKYPTFGTKKSLSHKVSTAKKDQLCMASEWNPHLLLWWRPAGLRHVGETSNLQPSTRKWRNTIININKKNIN